MIFSINPVLFFCWLFYPNYFIQHQLTLTEDLKQFFCGIWSYYSFANHCSWRRIWSNARIPKGIRFCKRFSRERLLCLILREAERDEIEKLKFGLVLRIICLLLHPPTWLRLENSARSVIEPKFYRNKKKRFLWNSATAWMIQSMYSSESDMAFMWKLNHNVLTFSSGTSKRFMLTSSVIQ